MKNNLTNSYYIINIYSELYKSLLSQNKTYHLITLENNKQDYDKIYPYLLNTTIIVTSYDQAFFKQIIIGVSYIKYLYVNHGITYFKSDFNFIPKELGDIPKNQKNIISSSPFEYSILVNKFKYSSNYIYKAGLARYDKYNEQIKNNSSKQCILAFFTYRNYNNSLFEKSLYKLNIEKLITDKLLINYLIKKNIDFILVQHHVDKLLKKRYNLNSSSYVKIIDSFYLPEYITKCSLLITDFSSISFAFIFQNKPTLFYLVDYKDNIDFEEKKYLKFNDSLHFGNSFLDKNELIEKIMHFIDNDFKISQELKRKYESVFYYKYNITKRISEIINQIIHA